MQPRMILTVLFFCAAIIAYNAISPAQAADLTKGARAEVFILDKITDPLPLAATATKVINKGPAVLSPSSLLGKELTKPLAKKSCAVRYRFSLVPAKSGVHLLALRLAHLGSNYERNFRGSISVQGGAGPVPILDNYQATIRPDESTMSTPAAIDLEAGGEYLIDVLVRCGLMSDSSGEIMVKMPGDPVIRPLNTDEVYLISAPTPSKSAAAEQPAPAAVKIAPANPVPPAQPAQPVGAK